MIDNSCTPAENLLLIVELRKKILTFRDIIDLPPRDDHGPINEFVIGTVKDLHKLYPKVVPSVSMSDIDGTSTLQVLSKLYNALTSIGDSWVKNHSWLSKFKCDKDDMKNISLAQLGGRVLAKLDYIIMVARKMFDVMDEDGNKSDESPRNSEFGDSSDESYSDIKASLCLSPVTPTSVLPEFNQSFADVSYSPPLLLPLRLQAVGKLKPIDVKRLAFHMFPHVSRSSSPENERKPVHEVEPEKKRTRSSSENDVTDVNAEPTDFTATEIIPQIRNQSGLENSGATFIPKAPPLPPPLPAVRGSKAPLRSMLKEPNATAKSSQVLPMKISTKIHPEPPIVPSKIPGTPSQSSTMLPPLETQPSFSTLELIPSNACPVEVVPSPAPKFTSNAFVPPISPMLFNRTSAAPVSMLPKSTSGAPHPPPPPPMLQENVSSAPPSMLPQKSSMAPPPPLPPPTNLLNAFAATSMSANVSVAPTPPPTILPTKASLPPLASQNASQAPPPPPLPPPMLGANSSITPPSPKIMETKASAPPPPPMLQTNASAAPPPPPLMPSPRGSTPPPPPMLQQNGSTAPPPPPPMLQQNGSTAPPPPPPMLSSRGLVPSPPPPMLSPGSSPPPPPPGAARALRPKKAHTKLKRSSHMGNLYRVLKGKVEGTNQDPKASNGRKNIGSSAGGSKQSMADALAEMTKRSSYFQQIEEDVEKHAKTIMEMKKAINSFETTDMTELHKFHQLVESNLEKLTDETQVLARFEDFPTKKLETLRTAAALYSKLDAMLTTLTTWKIEAPLAGLLDRVENYFNKIKGEVDALDRTKDDESKRFQSQKITFDFHILVRIKESMVDLSSSCMEFALKERREAKAASDGETGSKSEKRLKACTKMLWRAFQLAFRVYTFAGGHDDRADMLSRELAQEIENDPQH